MDVEPALLHRQAHPAGIGDAHAHAGILHGAGKAHGLPLRPGPVEIGLYSLQGLHKAGLRPHDLPIGQHFAGTNGVAAADLPGGDAHHVRHLIEQALDGEAGLGHAEAPEGPGRRVVGIVGVAVDGKVLIVVRPRRVGAGPLQNRPAQGGIRPGIGIDLCPDAQDVAGFVAAQGEVHLHGVALGVDEKALRPAELHLNGPLREIGRKSRVMLDGNVLLSAETPAHQAVADLHLLRREAQHPHGLVLGIVGALVRGKDHDSVPLRIGHGALRLQEGVLRPGGGEAAAQHVSRPGDGTLGVAPVNVLVGQEVSGGMHQRSALRHGLPEGADLGQLLIVNFHQGLGLGQDLRCLCRNEADGIAQVMGDASLGDHGIPVLHQVPHLVLPRDVLRRKDADNAGQGTGLLRVDGQHPGPGISAADGAGIDHAVQVDVIRIDAGALHLLLHVHPGDPGAHGPVARSLRQLPGAEDLRRQQNGVDDLHITRAAADVGTDGEGRLLPGGGGIDVQQPLGGHHHARGAETALDRPRLTEGVGVDGLLPVGKALRRDDGLPLQLVGLGDAGPRGLAVDEDGAGAAGAFAAAVLHGGETQLIPQETEELPVFLRGDAAAVDGESGHGAPPPVEN